MNDIKVVGSRGIVLRHALKFTQVISEHFTRHRTMCGLTLTQVPESTSTSGIRSRDCARCFPRKKVSHEHA
jgi:hypothetical protein